MTRTMKIDYDEKSSYANDLIKRAQFLQRSTTRARVLDAFLAQVSDFYDKETADSIFKQIDSLQYQLWQKEVDRVTKAVKTRKQNNSSDSSDNKDDDSEQSDKQENSDNSSDSDDNDDDKTDKSDCYNGIITVDKSKTKFYPKRKNHQNHQKKQHAHNKRRSQNHQQ